jgi:hypothetical protein
VCGLSSDHRTRATEELESLGFRPEEFCTEWKTEEEVEEVLRDFREFSWADASYSEYASVDLNPYAQPYFPPGYLEDADASEESDDEPPPLEPVPPPVRRAQAPEPQPLATILESNEEDAPTSPTTSTSALASSILPSGKTVESKTTLQTVRMRIFVHAEIRDRSLLRRLKKWCTRTVGSLPWMTIDQVTAVNDTGTDLLSEQITLTEATTDEAKCILREETTRGWGAGASSGHIAFFRKLLPQYYEAEIYPEMVQAAMRDPSLMRACIITQDSKGNLEIARSALPNVTDWTSRFMGTHSAHHYDTNIVTDTGMAIMNQVLVRSLRQHLATRVGSQTAVFRSGGRSQGSRR